jgi:hypothetical protein
MTVILTAPDGSVTEWKNIKEVEYDVNAFSVVPETGNGFSIPMINVLTLKIVKT